jgi:hypothetical protein
LQEAEFFCTRPSNQSYVRNRHKQFFSGIKKIFHSANLQSTIQAAGFLQGPPRSSFKKLLLGTGLWQCAKMSTSLKSHDGLKDAKCEKGQLSNRPPIPYVLVLRWTSKRPRKNLKFSRSSFRTSPTSVCPFTPMGTMRNILHTLLQSSKSLIRRSYPSEEEQY